MLDQLKAIQIELEQAGESITVAHLQMVIDRVEVMKLEKCLVEDDAENVIASNACDAIPG